MAWLGQGEALPTRAEHWSRDARPSHAERAAARTQLSRLAGGTELLLFERSRRDDEEDEPAECP